MIKHVFRFRVRYSDTDQMKFVYHAKFLEYFEWARTELLRDYGLPYSEIERMGYLIPVIEAYVKYKKPAYYDDLLRVITYMKEIPNLKFRVEYEVYREIDDELIAEGYTEHVFLDAKTYKPIKPPEFFINFLVEHIKSCKNKKC